MSKPIVVFGSFVVDLTSRSSGLPVPGQTILGNAFKFGPGGKGSNQAVAAHRAGANVLLVTKIGRDIFGDIALNFYQQEGMRTEFVLQDACKETGVALIMVDEITAQNKIVVVPGACANITPQEVESCRLLIESASLLLVQLEINFDALFKAVDIAYKSGVKIVLNPAPAYDLPAEIFRKVDTITPNETEAQHLTGVTVTDRFSAEKAAGIFLEMGIKNVVITMGAQGAFATDGQNSEFLPCLRVDAVDSTGAGDAFNGGFITALSEGRTLFEALRYGNATAALSVTRLGTAPSMPSRVEIDKMLLDNYGIRRTNV